MAALSSTFQSDERRRTVAGALAWWRDAGVEGAVSPVPRGWLDRPVARAAPPVEVEVEAEAPPPAIPDPAASAPDPLAPMPTELAAFRAWLAEAALPGVAAAGRRAVAAWAERSEVAVVLTMPQPSGALIAPPAERLLTAMMRAVGRSPGDTALIAACPANIGPRLPADTAAALRPTLIRHLALTGASRVLLLGEGPCRALLGESAPAARGRWHSVNHEGAELSAIATLDLATLLAQPGCKRDAWADLLLFVEGPTA